MNDLSIIENEVGMSMLEKVCRLEKELLKMPQAEIVTQHKFYPGFYERTIIIPPWTVLTGAPHKTDYSVRLEKGTISVNTDEGIKTLTAPCEFRAPAGVKRVGRVYEDEVVWTDIYENPDDCKNISVLDERLYEVPEIGMGDTRLKINHDRKDFNLFLEQIGMTQSEMDSVVMIEKDLMQMPEGIDVEVRDSKIHGKGLFANRDFQEGEIICPGRLNGKRTPAGRFTNHSINPNARPINKDGDIYALASRYLFKDEEILINYRESMKVNFGINMLKETS
jgi:hypothetical protein